ncbi:MAG: hypothetical protein HC890_08735 [Chloroflexaceae bacterium]|nr:hypothetical protein [Chloroflexaceae bacterium]
MKSGITISSLIIRATQSGVNNNPLNKTTLTQNQSLALEARDFAIKQLNFIEIIDQTLVIVFSGGDTAGEARGKIPSFTSAGVFSVANSPYATLYRGLPVRD